jgi:hypothetical protein
LLYSNAFKKQEATDNMKVIRGSFAAYALSISISSGPSRFRETALFKIKK